MIRGRLRIAAVALAALTVRTPHQAPMAVSLAWDARSQLARARVGTTRLTLPAP